jgi:cell division protein FtsZ
MKFEFVEKNDRYQAKIKVFGVGGAGGNAVNNMIEAKLRGVDFFVANTDSQDLDRSTCSNRIQLGAQLTKGLGAGADPEIGRQAAEESLEDIKEAVSEADMVFLTAGMGGGTGTGASPVVARTCKEGEALTVAVVTKPFHFEGDRRMNKALDGINKLKKEVDTLIIIPNERLKAIGMNKMSLRELFVKADDVLLQAVKGISDLINSNGFINLDFADVKKVMGQMGTAIMGTGRASGESRALEAAQQAINSPLLEDISISGAKGLLMNITASPDITMDEIDEASCYIRGEVSDDAEIFWGVAFDDEMGDEVQITVIATGIDRDNYNKVIKLRDVNPDEAEEPWTVRVNGEIVDGLDVPTFQRNKENESLPQTMNTESRENGRRGIIKRAFFKDNLDYPTFLRAKAD